MNKSETAECNICGAKIRASDQEMMLHIVTKHPMELVTSRGFIEKVSSFFFKLGGTLAERMKR